MEVRIAPADPRDDDARDLIAALSRELAARYDNDDAGSGNFDPAAGVGERGVFLIAYAGDAPVGCGAIRAFDHATAEVKRMYVRPDARGHGYSRALLTALERAAAEFGYTSLCLETGDRQAEAIGLYERAGYQRMEKFGIYVDSARSVCFEKRLGARV